MSEMCTIPNRRYMTIRQVAEEHPNAPAERIKIIFNLPGFPAGKDEYGNLIVGDGDLLMWQMYTTAGHLLLNSAEDISSKDIQWFMSIGHLDVVQPQPLTKEDMSRINANIDRIIAERMSYEMDEDIDD